MQQVRVSFSPGNPSEVSVQTSRVTAPPMSDRRIQEPKRTTTTALKVKGPAEILALVACSDRGMRPHSSDLLTLARRQLLKSSRLHLQNP